MTPISTADFLLMKNRLDASRKAAQLKKANETATDTRIPNPVTERDQAPALGGANEGKAARDERAVVRFEGYRVRPLDPDNFAGSVKDLLDGLRHAGLIPGDEPWRIRLETEQFKVGSFNQEKTVIEIVTP